MKREDDYVVMGIVTDYEVRSVRHFLDKDFEKNSYYCHERNFGKRGPRWRYRCATNTVYWYDSVSDDTKEAVNAYLKRVYNVERPTHLKTGPENNGWAIAHGAIIK